MARNPVVTRSNGSGVRGTPMPRVKPFSEMGVSSVPIFGGFIMTMERNTEWVGQWKYKTASEIATNVSIVAAGLHYFLSLVARPKWKVVPSSDEKPKAIELAEYMEEVIDKLSTPWPRVIRRSGMYRFYGFSIQEWTALKRKDGKIGLKDIEPRSQYTIEQWTVREDGTIDGVWQRSPQTSEMLPIPRRKMIYVVEDTLSDSPEGLGILRHMAEPYNRLKKFLELETMAFERDLRGTPIGRAPLTAIREAIDAGKITQARGDALIQGMHEFVAQQTKSQTTGVVLDSVPYTSVSTDGPKVSGLYQWGIELLQGSANGLQELHNAIDRLQREMARIGGWESLMLGDSSNGSRALSEDKSRALYLIANSVLSNIAAQMTKDLIEPIWQLNNFDDDLMPQFQAEDVSFRDVDQVSRVLRDMATAGAVLAPDDPVIDDMRDLLGVSRQPEREEDEMDAMVRSAMGMPTEMDQEQQELSIAQQRSGLSNPEGVGDVMGLDDPRGDKPVASDEEDEEKTKKAFDESKIRRKPGGQGGGKAFKKTRPSRFTWEDVDLEVGEDDDDLGKAKGYDPNQPREPKGSPEGGRWTDGDAGSSNKDDKMRGFLHRLVHNRKGKFDQESADWVSEYLLGGKSLDDATLDDLVAGAVAHRKEHGQYTGGRSKLIDEIISAGTSVDSLSDQFSGFVEVSGDDVPWEGEDPTEDTYEYQETSWDLNSALRGLPNADGDKIDLNEIYDDPKAFMRSLDQTIAAGKLSKDVRVYRGAHESVWAKLSKAKIGSTFTDKAYVSTSPDKSVAARFGGGGVLTVLVPKGKGHIAPFDEDGSELVIARGSTFKVVGKDLKSNNIYVQLMTKARKWDDDFEKDYDPNQPRKPKGSPEGGRWTDGYAPGSPAEGHGYGAHMFQGLHGTSAAAAESILKQGLLNTPPVRNFSEEYYSDGRGRSVFMAHDMQMAITYAVGADVQDPVILEIEVPKEFAGKVRDDEIDNLAVRYEGNIPPEWIKAVHRFKGSDYEFDEEEGWERFELKKSASQSLFVFVDLDKYAKEHGIEKFDPNQPRVPAGSREGGRWTDGSVPGASKPADATQQEEHRADHFIADATALLARNMTQITEEELLASLTQEERDKIAWVEAEMAKRVPTNALVSDGGFRNADGTWSEERQALHAQILENFFNDDAVARATPAAGEAPIFAFLGGRPAAGKTSSLKAGAIELDRSKYMNVAADDLQEFLPGYEKHLSGLYNQEGQYLAERAERMARDAKLNIIYDATMKSTAPALERVLTLKQEGYKVNVYFTHTSPETAARRSVKRFTSGDRYVPPRVSLSSLTNEQTFDRVREHLNDWALFDNNGTAPRLVARKG